MEGDRDRETEGQRMSTNTEAIADFRYIYFSNQSNQRINNHLLNIF